MFERELLKGKRILVTGGGSGLGREIAAKYLDLGAEVHICGRRKAVLDGTAAELMSPFGGRVETHPVDVRHADDIDAMVGRIWQDFGPSTAWSTTPPATSSAAPSTSRRAASTRSPASSCTAPTTRPTHVGRRWIASGHKGSVISIVVTWVRTGAPSSCLRR